MWFSIPPSVRPGDAAPTFTLSAHDGRAIALVDFRASRRVVLTFFRDETGRLREALSSLDAAMPRFRTLKTQLLAVSPSERAAHSRLAEKLALRFPLLSDPDGEVARRFGVVSVGPLFRRLTVVIDGRGLVRLVMTGHPTTDDVIAFLEGLHGDLPGA